MPFKGKKTQPISGRLGKLTSTGPQFSPVGGIGSIWEDPDTGETYRFTAQGWIKETKTQTEGSSFEIKPDEQELVNKLKEGGSNESQIRQGLVERRRILSNVDQGQVETEPIEQKPQTQNPFGNMSKREVLLDAFNKGVTDPNDLKELETLYDTLVGDEGTEVEIAEQFIADNPNASREELFVALREKTELDVSTINALLEAGGAVQTEDIGELTEDEMRDIAITAVKDETGLFTNSQKGKESAKRTIDAQPDLTRQQKTQIKQIIDQEFPEGRTFWNKILPFGK